jgi:hypothetical protein
MKPKNLITLTILCIIMPHAYTMELVPLEEIKKTEKTTCITNYECGYFTQLPLECIDTIIFLNTPEAMGFIKNTCKYFSLLASIVRINDEPFRQLIINDKQTRLDLFKNIVKTDNPEYIKKILEHGKREAHFYRKEAEDSIVITLDKSLIEQEYLDQEYLPFLLKDAIKQNKYHSVDTLIKNSSDTFYNNYNYLEQAVKYDSDNAIKALLDCNAFDKEQIDDALATAYFDNKHKALELLSEKTGDYEYLDILKKQRCARIKDLIYVGTMIILVMTGGIASITFKILGYYNHNNGTMP